MKTASENLQVLKDKIKNSEIKELKEIDINYLVEQEILECFLKINASEVQIKKLIECHNSIFTNNKIELSNLTDIQWKTNDEMLMDNTVTLEPEYEHFRRKIFDFFYYFLLEDLSTSSLIKSIDEHIDNVSDKYTRIKPENRFLAYSRSERDFLKIKSLINLPFKEAKYEIIKAFKMEGEYAPIPYAALPLDLKKDKEICEWSIWQDTNNSLYFPKEIREDKEFMNKLRKEGYSV